MTIESSGPPFQTAVAVVAGDGSRFRRLVALVESDPALSVVQGDGSEAAAVEGLATRAPDDDGAETAVVLVDVPSGLGDDVDLVQSIARQAGDAAIVVVGPDLDLAVELLLAGASGVMPRDASLDDLGEAVACVVRGDAAVPPEIATRLLRRYQMLAEV